MKRENLKKARLSLDLTQGQVAEKIGIHIDHVRSLEYGRVNPSSKLMFKICAFYKATPEALFRDIVNC
ncbi:MAG: helix-turn-helix transcriptional regulator [Eubacteriales bacterium]